MKRIIIFFILINLFYLSSSQVLKENKANLDNYKMIYGKTMIKFRNCSENDFKSFNILDLIKGSVTDSELSEAEIKEKNNAAKNFIYADNQYFIQMLICENPVSTEDLNFKFIITDKNNNDLTPDVFFINETSGGNGIYMWIVRTKTPLDKKNIDKKNFPISIKIIYPDSGYLSYKIL